MTKRVARNVLANFLGRGLGALLAIILTPIYIRLLGMEAYGLVGMFITLQALLPILDMGLGMAANREAAVLSVRADGIQKIRNLMRTLEWVYWGMAIIIATAVALLADVITHHWVNAQALQPAEVRTAIVLMGVILGAQLPVSLYGGVLMGLQLQVPFSVLNMAFSTMRALGAVLVVEMSPSVTSFFQWQVFVSAIQLVVTAAYLWRQVPAESHFPKFDLKSLHQIKKFAAQMSGITFTGAAFMQLDKVVLSRILSLEHFGYYFVASTAASGLYLVVSPIFGALFPTFSQLVSQRDEERIRVLYEQASQLMAVAVWPATAVTVVFSQDLLLLWTHNQQAAESGATILALLVFGNALNGVVNAPYALQLASGKAGQVLKVNAFLMLFSVPAIIFLASSMGGVGAALAWVAYTFAAWVANAVMAGKWFVYLNWRGWLWNGHLLPASISVLIAAVGYRVRMAYGTAGWGEVLLIIVLTILAAQVAAGVSSPRLLELAKNWSMIQKKQRHSS
jgi:O-antigen/teichoic acid export membrane protein